MSESPLLTQAKARLSSLAEQTKKPADVGASEQAESDGAVIAFSPDFTVVDDSLAGFIEALLPQQGHFFVWTKHNKKHHICGSHDELIECLEHFADTPDTYYATAAFGGEISPTTGEIGRLQSNVTERCCMHVDFDCGDAKQAKDPDGTYATQKDALADIVRFQKATGIKFSHILDSGTGIHAYISLGEDIDEQRWKALAKSLQALMKQHCLKADDACTADSARILRAPGSLHNNGKRVQLLHSTGHTTSPHELEQTIVSQLDHKALTIAKKSASRARNVNADVLDSVEGPPKTIRNIAVQCAAVRELISKQGNVVEPFWRAGLGIAKFTVEGFKAAQVMSMGHPGYDKDATRDKFNRWSTGPTSCQEFAKYCRGCYSCQHFGSIKSPIVLGPMTTVQLKNTDVGAPVWVTSMNVRLAVVRIGQSAKVLDRHTPKMTATGVGYELGYLEMSAARALYAGQTVEVGTGSIDGLKHIPIMDAWLRHPQRRQYEGVTFAPGISVPANILNTYEGFGVEPQQGDVTPWLAVLDALVPDVTMCGYVLNWLAWKIQNPGGVPDTVLIFTGAKGTGKNSLFDPLLAIFGKHAMLADDPELIAGRFTWHLMGLCFAVLDEAVFIGDPRQQDRIKSRVTAKTMQYEQKGVDPVSGVNRCAYVMLTNHAHVWQATQDERRAAVVEVGEGLRGNLEFWVRYHDWQNGTGPSALLHHLLQVDLAGFNPRAIPKGDALRRQVELTAMRDPAVAWWHACLSEGSVRRRDGITILNDEQPTEIDRTWLRESFEESAGARGRAGSDWQRVYKKLQEWTGGIKSTRPREGATRGRRDVLPPAVDMRRVFAECTQVQAE